MVTAPIWHVLEQVLDPEVPAISVVELGIVRDVEVEQDGTVTVSVTPTYSGCPAMDVIEREIVAALAEGGWHARVRRVYSPAWTTDWIGTEAREKLTAYGIAPPPPATGAMLDHLVPLRRQAAVAAVAVACPYCGSSATTTRSEFGPTACKAVMFCDACRQPFELFKAI
jgi:ring-1,2-phenylacetyl-CoA epoxidase subunit PaaD